ncbi:ABC transporter ATP-binding protein [Allocoprobacillus halotolerans]|uniref:ABC transporter ATP-binding protein n=1 Tax=Allocoprobacillus halotolerans TaxID=2944914 RepID=A0ABY5I642_9FIRM|nr:ABC transporter ATP-binding protein [Allocoprobacillus halotolerans]UTY40237.1 ABC transporter ATP-binding protein [Allocoprobacillus halotolerans]
MIVFQHISKSFHQNLVLKDVYLSIEEGSLIRMSGPNGCGKSTLLKIAVGLMKSDAGEVVYEDKHHIGALIENPCFIENETGLYNLKFLYNLKNRYDDQKVRALLKKFLLDPNLKIPVKKYSVGMKQKLGIIQAIMEDQNVIYLDEPTRGLDEESVKFFYQLIDDLHRQGKTIIICSHEELNELHFDKEFVLKDGILNKKI